MNWLQTAANQRPDLPTRENEGGQTEVQCPVCGNWRPGFVLAVFASADAVRFGASWGCDNERSVLAREAVAAAEAAAPPDPARWLSKFDWLLLWTPAERVAVRSSTDAAMADYWMLFSAWEGPMNINDASVAVGITRARELGILTEARAARILAGLPPAA